MVIILETKNIIYCHLSFESLDMFCNNKINNKILLDYFTTKPNLHHFCTTFDSCDVIKMRDSQSPSLFQGFSFPLLLSSPLFYDVPGIKSGTKVVHIGLRLLKLFLNINKTIITLLIYLCIVKLMDSTGAFTYFAFNIEPFFKVFK